MSKLVREKRRVNRRKLRVKKKIQANLKGRYRLCINRSNKNFYVQIVDDVKGHTLLGLSTLSDEFKDMGLNGNMKAAQELGKKVAEKALTLDIKEVVFDRNGYLYHGKIKAFADAARESGLKF